MSALALAFVAETGDAADDGTPDEWDRRVVEYVQFVERERGLEFEHPVRVRFLARRRVPRGGVRLVRRHH